MGVSSPLNIFQNSVKPSGPGLLCARRFFLLFLQFHQLLSVCLGFVFREDYILEICPFHPGLQILGIELFVVISYNTLHFCAISCNFSFFISDFIYVGPLSFFLMNLVKGLSVLLIFSKNQLLNSLISCIFF